MKLGYVTLTQDSQWKPDYLSYVTSMSLWPWQVPAKNLCFPGPDSEASLSSPLVILEDNMNSFKKETQTKYIFINSFVFHLVVINATLDKEYKKTKGRFNN